MALNPKNWSRSIVLLGCLVILVGGGTAVAQWEFAAGAVNSPVASPGAGMFPQQLVVSTAAFGDRVHAIDTGRDNQGPYASILVELSPTNPIVGILPPDVYNDIGMALVAPYGPMPGMTVPPQGPGARLIQLIYRSTNDPGNPGWGVVGAPAGGPNQLDNSMQTCLQVANQLAAFRDIATGAPAPGVSAALVCEISIPAAGAPMRDFEFYKFSLIR